jgi:hypothetical protein
MLNICLNLEPIWFVSLNFSLIEDKYIYISYVYFQANNFRRYRIIISALFALQSMFLTDHIKNSMAFSPPRNHTDRATVAC